MDYVRWVRQCFLKGFPSPPHIHFREYNSKLWAPKCTLFVYTTLGVTWKMVRLLTCLTQSLTSINTHHEIQVQQKIHVTTIPIIIHVRTSRYPVNTKAVLLIIIQSRKNEPNGSQKSLHIWKKSLFGVSYDLAIAIKGDI